MDNASIHISFRVVELIEEAGAICLFQSAYSPDLNPIEKCFRQYKCALKRRLSLLRRDPLAAHQLALDSVKRNNMLNYYRAVGAIQNVPNDDDDDQRREYFATLATTLLATANSLLLAVMNITNT